MHSIVFSQRLVLEYSKCLEAGRLHSLLLVVCALGLLLGLPQLGFLLASSLALLYVCAKFVGQAVWVAWAHC